MRLSALKSYFASLIVYIFISIFILPSFAQADDIQAKLTDNSGNTGFSVENSTSVEKARIDSNGNISTSGSVNVSGNVGIGTVSGQAGLLLNVAYPGSAPEYVGIGGAGAGSGAGDVYIQNNLEVAGITYLNDVYINGLNVNGATFSGNVGIGTINTLTVRGSSYLATSSGNVGIGTTQPVNYFSVGATSPFQVDNTGAIAAVTGITTSGGYTQSGVQVNTISGKTAFTAAGTTATFSGNVGIGTTTPQASLVVTNGNVGIGTWAPTEPLAVGANAFTVAANGSVTTATGITTTGKYLQSGNAVNTFTGNVGLGTTAPQGSLVVTNGNVGVGTWAPLALLDVTTGGAKGPEYLQLANGQGAGSDAYIQNDMAVDGTAYFNDIVIDGSLSVTGVRFAGVQTLDSLEVLGNTFLAVNSGFVGVGTTLPGETLDVNGTIRIVGTNPLFLGSDNRTSISASSANLSDIKFTTNNAEAMRITNTGNVGIGTTTPQGGFVVTNGNVGIGTWAPTAPLTVGVNAFTVAANGTITTTTGIQTAGTYAQTGNSVNVFSGNVGLGTTTPQASLVVTNGNVGIGTWAPTAPLAVGANAFTVDATGAITTATGITSTGKYLQTGNSVNTFSGNVGLGTTTPQGSLVVTNGNVGIGTWAPMAMLDVTTGGAKGPEYLQLANGIGAGSDAYVQNDMAVDGTAYFSDVVIDGSLSVTGLHFSGLQTLDKLEVTGGTYLATAGSNVGIGTTMTGVAAGTKLDIMGGNVGIATVSPGVTLDVGGTVRITGTNRLILGSDNTTSIAASSANASDIKFVTNNNEAMRIANSGNIGIGTTTPQGSLIVTNGNVGIGTWAPTAPLAVGANAFTVDATGAITTATGITSTGKYLQTGNSVNTFSGNVGLGTTTPQGSLVITNGNVGIGTWAPLAMLDVTTGGAKGPEYLQLANGVGAGSDAYVQNDMAVDGTAYFSDVVIDGSLSVTGLHFTGAQTLDKLEVTGGAYLATAGSNVGIGTTMTGVAAGTKLDIMGGNVGIATVSPGVTLDVGGTVRITGTNRLILGSDNGTSIAASSANASDIKFVTNNNEAMRIANSGNIGIGTTTPQGSLIVTNGNVGIGTWAPTAPLAVGANAFTVDATGAITTATGITSTGKYLQTGNSVNTFSGNVGLGTTTPQGSLVVTNGNVGIGTWAPMAMLDVTTGGAKGPEYLQLANGVGAGSDAYVQNDMAVDGTAYFSDVVIDGSLSVTGLHFTGSQTLDKLEVTGGTYLATSGSNVGIGTTMTGVAAGTKLDIMGGNVGIATASPGETLDVNGTVRITGTNPLILGSDNGTSIAASSANASDIKFITNNTEAMRIANSGNIGIGTTTPQGSLIVTNGNVGIGTWAPTAPLAVGANAFTVDATGAITTATGITSTGKYLQTGNSVNTFSGNVGLGTTTPQGSLVVTNGNVGIGTWAPLAMLDVTTGGAKGPEYLQLANGVGAGSDAYVQNDMAVDGTAYFSDVVIDGSLSVTGLHFSGLQTLDKLEVTGGTYLATAGSNVGIGTTMTGVAAGTKLDIMGGNVGIATASPGETLDVNGTVRITGTNPLILGSDNGASISASSPTSTDIKFVTNNAEAMRITNGGNVGIGTTTPQAALVVTGNVGIGTWSAAGGNLIVNGGGNVGIGSIWPGAKLDVKGSVRMTAFNLSSSTTPGYILTSDASGNGTWQINAASGSLWAIPPASLMDQTLAGGNVGIGTTLTTTAALTVMNGNVGIGTWVTSAALDLKGSLALEPSAVVDVTAGGITVTHAVMRIQASGGGAVVISANPQIAAGVDGQMVTLIGSSSVKTVKISNGNGLKLNSGVSFTFGLSDIMVLIYDATNNVWTEISRAVN